MPGDLDSILVTVDCPACGAAISVPWQQVRVHKATACGCGVLIAIEDDTPLAAVQRLIDEASPPSADNDA